MIAIIIIEAEGVPVAGAGRDGEFSCLVGINLPGYFDDCCIAEVGAPIWGV